MTDNRMPRRPGPPGQPGKPGNPHQPKHPHHYRVQYAQNYANANEYPREPPFCPFVESNDGSAATYLYSGGYGCPPPVKLRTKGQP